jgi:hypothetical protein
MKTKVNLASFRGDIGVIRWAFTPFFRNHDRNPKGKKKNNAQPGDAFEDTVFPAGFEKVKL